MTYIIEHNYILDADSRSLMAVRIDVPDDTRLFLCNSRLGEYIQLLDEQEDESSETDEGTSLGYNAYRPKSNGPITIEEVNGWISMSEDEYLIEVFPYFESENEFISFSGVRLLLFYYMEKDWEKFFKVLAKLYPDLDEPFKMYKKSLKREDERHQIWSQYWIGFTDSEENRIIMTVSKEGMISLEYTDEWSYAEDATEAESYIEASNVFNQFILSTVSQIKTKEEFLAGLKRLFTSASESDYGNRIELGDLQFDYENMADRTNKVSSVFQIKSEELEAVLLGLKR